MHVRILFLILLSVNVQLSHQACGLSNSCQNSGVCQNTECQCVQGFIGDLCEHEVQFEIQAPVSNEIVEGNDVMLTVTRPNSGFQLQLTVQTIGSATKDVDYVLSPPNVDFSPSQTSATLNIDVVQDVIAEPGETITVTLTAGDGTTADITYTIKASDLVVTLPVLMGVSEESLTKDIEISRTIVDDAITVRVNTVDGTAVAGTDYNQLANHEVTFAAGAGTATFTVTVTDNQVNDGDKTFEIAVSGDAIVTNSGNTFFILDDDGGRAFDCRRHNQGCTESTDICENLPMCKCVGTPAREGVMCNIITDQKNGQSCLSNNIDCNSNGICLDNNGVTSCACNPGFYGDNCEHDRLEAVCSKDDITLIANPHGNFAGKIYVVGKADISACTATVIDNQARTDNSFDGTVNGYLVVVPHNSVPCGAITPEEFEEDGTTHIRYKRQILIQYQTSPNIATGLDQIVSVTCKFVKDNLVVNAGVVTLDPNRQFTEESRSKTLNLLSIEVRSSTGVVTESVVIPIATRLCMTLRIPVDFGGLEINYIEFNDNLPTDPEKLRIYESGCNHDSYRSVSFDGPFYPESGNKRLMKFCFAAFTFSSSSQLAVEISVKICLISNNCQLRECIPFRRKRQVDTSREETVSAAFNITTGSDQSPEGGSGQTGIAEVKKKAVCNLPLEFVPTVIALGVVILLLVLLCLCLMYRIVRRGQEDKSTESAYHKH